MTWIHEPGYFIRGYIRGGRPYQEFSDADETLAQSSFEHLRARNVFWRRFLALAKVDVLGNDTCTMLTVCWRSSWHVGLTSVDDAHEKEHRGQRIAQLMTGDKGPENPIDNNRYDGADKKRNTFDGGSTHRRFVALMVLQTQRHDGERQAAHQT
jgi:hypothetical protein